MSTAARDQHMKSSLNAIEKSSQRIIEFLTGEEQATALNELYENTKAYCMLEERAAISASAIRNVKLMLEDQENEEMSFEETYQTQVEEGEQKIGDLKQHANYIKFDKIVKAMLNQDDEMASDSGGDSDADLRVTEAEINTIDPISQQAMVSPVKNKSCGHSYEKSTILQMLRQKKRMRCPYVGCPNDSPFGPDDLEDDQALKQILKRKRVN